MNHTINFIKEYDISLDTKHNCNGCPLIKHCSKTIQRKNSNERIMQCNIAKNIYCHNMIISSDYLIDKGGKAPKMLRYYDTASHVHSIRVTPKIDIIINNGNRYIPIEVKSVGLRKKINNIIIMTTGEKKLFLISPNSFMNTGQLFTDFFKNHNSVINSFTDLAFFYCHTTDSNNTLFEFYKKLFTCSMNFNTTFIMLDEMRTFKTTKISPVWGSLTFKSTNLHITENVISLKMISKTTCLDSQNIHQLPEYEHLSTGDHSILDLSLNECQNYSDRIANKACAINIHKISENILKIGIYS